MPVDLLRKCCIRMRARQSHSVWVVYRLSFGLSLQYQPQYLTEYSGNCGLPLWDSIPVMRHPAPLCAPQLCPFVEPGHAQGAQRPLRRARAPWPPDAPQLLHRPGARPSCPGSFRGVGVPVGDASVQFETSNFRAPLDVAKLDFRAH